MKASQWPKIGTRERRRKGRGALNLRITSFTGNSERQNFNPTVHRGTPHKGVGRGRPSAVCSPLAVLERSAARPVQCRVIGRSDYKGRRIAQGPDHRGSTVVTVAATVAGGLASAPKRGAPKTRRSFYTLARFQLVTYLVTYRLKNTLRPLEHRRSEYFRCVPVILRL
ncbi:hypothetical protein EVAR_27372_1 [Eumeta japonica]|uniref:Uncharacterized protein n=1 Tax=Eumeta variegata TaxID=151549 RepID=A0A4C1X4U6_EUMVA|nr:hypothetical protein EVAR_27372_1 [Eumeta japonica]